MAAEAVQPLDVDAQRRVHELVRKATQERQQTLDPALLRDIKGLCKTDDENVRSAYAAITVALRSRHSQVCSFECGVACCSPQLHS